MCICTLLLQGVSTFLLPGSNALFSGFVISVWNSGGALSRCLGRMGRKGAHTQYCLRPAFIFIHMKLAQRRTVLLLRALLETFPVPSDRL